MTARVIPLGPSQQATYPDKTFATLQARAALAGATLTRFEDDRGDEVFVVGRWALTRQLRTLDEVAAWLDKLTGRAIE